MASHARKALAVGAGAAFAIGAGLITAGYFEPKDHLTALGCTAVVCSTMAWAGVLLGTLICQRFRPWRETWEVASEAGYTRGYEDGRKIARPVVVRLPARPGRHRQLTGGPVS